MVILITVYLHMILQRCGMTQRMQKFDIQILDTSTDRFKYIKPVTSLDTFQGINKDFHEDGLFSTSIFGKVGTPDRDQRMSFINTRIEVFHPKVYSLICSYRQLYKKIIAGTEYAKWDPKEKDFIKSTNIDGSTGFNFFLQHWKEIKFVKNDSFSQNEGVDVILKNKTKGLTSKIMVIPAGLRDVEIGDNEEITKHEINDFYTKLLSVSNSLPSSGDLNSSLNDRARLSLQLTFCELYDYLSTLTGRMKKSFMRHKWGTRKVKYGSRDVLTTVYTSPRYVGDGKALGFNETAIGLYQASAVYSPVLIHQILQGYMSKIYNPVDGKMNIVNSKSMVREEHQVKPKIIDRWTTPTGISKIIDSLGDNYLRNQSIMIGGGYLGLVYKDEKHFKLINDINDLDGRTEFNPKNVYPLTYGEFFYIMGYELFKKYPGTVTRYPINGYRSIYPTYAHVFTTNRDFELTPLDDDWNPDYSRTAFHYPDPTDQNWFDSMAPHPSRLVGLGADYDGDMCNFNPIFSLEAVTSVEKYLKSIPSYINSSGKLLNDPFSETLQRICWSLTGDVE